MFRPNRIGTPIIHDSTGVVSTAAWAPSSNLNTSIATGFNTVNAAPVADFGKTTMAWDTGAAALAANSQFALGQQYTITQPLAGDTVGVELGASLDIVLPTDFDVTGIHGRLVAAIGTALLGASVFDIPTFFHPTPGINGAPATVLRTFQYKEQIIVRNSSTLLPGTYYHGFRLSNRAAAPFNFIMFRFSGYVRQLNDQPNIRYRDTLR